MTASLLIKTRHLSMVSVFLVLFMACQNSTTPPQWQWERAEAGLPRQAIVLTVAANPLDANQLWAGYYEPGGLASSLDGGQTWTTGAAGLDDNPIFELLPIVDDSGTGGALWAATRDGLLQSFDAGTTWQTAVGNLPAVTAFALATDSTGRLYVGLDGAGIYVQIRNGQEWQAVTVTDPLASTAVLSLAVSPDGQQLYAGTSGQGVFASRDSGKSWVRTYPGEYAPTLALNPNNPAVAVASLRNRLVRTRDGGVSWHTIPLPWVEYNEIVSLLWLVDGSLGAGTSQGRLYRSLDDGETWVEGGAGLPPGGVLALNVPRGQASNNSRQLLAGTWTGVYGSEDNGQTWAHLTPSLGIPHAQTLLAVGDDIWLGARTGLFRWQPESHRWVRTNSNLPSGVASFIAAPADPQVMYIGTLSSGVYRSVDGGVTWEALPTLIAGVPDLAVDPVDPSHIYILAAWERVYESRDGGQNWHARWDGLGQVIETTSLAIDPFEPIVYVGTETGLYRSDNGGEWFPVAPELVDQTILALMVQSVPNITGNNSILYIGTTRGVYRSVNRGVTVEGSSPKWGHGLENLSVTALLVDDRASRHLYAGTAYGGVYQSVDGGRNWYPIGPTELGDDIVKAMAWGPDGEMFVVAANSVWRGQQNNEQ